VIDLSYTAALKLDILRGVTPVEVERITYEDIRSGAWQRGDNNTAVFASAAAVGAPQLTSTAQVAAPADAQKSALADGLPRASAPGFWVQLGAFSKLDGAEAMRRKLVGELDWMAPLLAVFKDSGLHRLQAGPYASREDARQAAQRVRSVLALAAVVVERQ
ncbi:SPOR domain-containing protein, partial [Roseateles sp. GG27B]